MQLPDRCSRQGRTNDGGPGLADLGTKASRRAGSTQTTSRSRLKLRLQVQSGQQAGPCSCSSCRFTRARASMVAGLGAMRPPWQAVRITCSASPH